MKLSEGKWVVGRYEDTPFVGFIGQEGDSICWVDGLLIGKVETIVERHNNEVAQLEAEVERLQNTVDYIWDEIYESDTPVLSVASVEMLRRNTLLKGGE